MQTLNERIAVVTGAGSGIGRATSLALARRGCHLALVDIDGAALDETATQVRAFDRRATTHVVDVSDKQRMETLASEVVDHHGAVHVLINNAGVSVSATFAEHTLEDFEWLMGINFWGVVYGCKFFLPHLLRGPEGHVVNISSVFGLVGVPRQASYCASKFAVRGFSETLRVELAKTKVGVTSVHPGGVATNIAAKMRVAGGPEAVLANERVIERFKRMLPPEIAAESIVEGIVHNRSRVLITRETHLADLVKRILPGLSTDLVAWGYERFVEKHLNR